MWFMQNKRFYLFLNTLSMYIKFYSVYLLFLKICPIYIKYFYSNTFENCFAEAFVNYDTMLLNNNIFKGLVKHSCFFCFDFSK